MIPVWEIPPLFLPGMRRLGTFALPWSESALRNTAMKSLEGIYAIGRKRKPYWSDWLRNISRRLHKWAGADVLHRSARADGTGTDTPRRGAKCNLPDLTYQIEPGSGYTLPCQHWRVRPPERRRGDWIISIDSMRAGRDWHQRRLLWRQIPRSRNINWDMLHCGRKEKDMKISELIKENWKPTGDKYGDIPVMLHHEADTEPFEVDCLHEDFDDFGVQFINIVFVEADWLLPAAGRITRRPVRPKAGERETMKQISG